MSVLTSHSKQGCSLSGMEEGYGSFGAGLLLQLLNFMVLRTAHSSWDLKRVERNFLHLQRALRPPAGQ